MLWGNDSTLYLSIIVIMYFFQIYFIFYHRWIWIAEIRKTLQQRMYGRLHKRFYRYWFWWPFYGMFNGWINWRSNHVQFTMPEYSVWFRWSQKSTCQRRRQSKRHKSRYNILLSYPWKYFIMLAMALYIMFLGCPPVYLSVWSFLSSQ